MSPQTNATRHQITNDDPRIELADSGSYGILKFNKNSKEGNENIRLESGASVTLTSSQQPRQYASFADALKGLAIEEQRKDPKPSRIGPSGTGIEIESSVPMELEGEVNLTGATKATGELAIAPLAKGEKGKRRKKKPKKSRSTPKPSDTPITTETTSARDASPILSKDQEPSGTSEDRSTTTPVTARVLREPDEIDARISEAIANGLKMEEEKEREAKEREELEAIRLSWVLNNCS
jgi:hypothetical protein